GNTGGGIATSPAEDALGVMASCDVLFGKIDKKGGGAECRRLRETNDQSNPRGSHQRCVEGCAQTCSEYHNPRATTSDEGWRSEEVRRRQIAAACSWLAAGRGPPPETLSSRTRRARLSLADRPASSCPWPDSSCTRWPT